MLYIKIQLPFTYTIIMKTALLTVALLFLGVNPVFTQEDSLFIEASRIMEAGEFRDAAQLFTQYLQNPDTQKDIRGKANGLYKLAACFFYMNEYDSTIKYMEGALVEKAKLVAPSDTFLLSSHAVLGYVYRYERRDIRKAAAQFDSERDIINAHPTAFSQTQVYKNYYNLASANRILQDYDRALNYAYQALEVAQKMYAEHPEYAENCYVVIANSLSGKKQYKQADEFYRRKVAVSIEQRGAEHSSLALDYYNLALNYNDMARPHEAIISFRSAEDIANKSNRSLLSNVYRGLGVAHRLSGNSDTSLEYFYKAIPMARPRPLRSAWNYRQIALHYEISNQFDSALYNYQKAFLALIPDFEWAEPEVNPALNRLVSSNPYVYKLLELKANCYLKAYYSSRDKEDLLAAKDSYDLLDQLTDKYRDNLVLESSRLFFQQRNHAVYQKAIEVNFELYRLSAQMKYIENAWMLIEKNKSILLLENLLSAEKYTSLGIPDSIQEQMTNSSKALLNAQKNLNSCELQKDCEQDKIITIRQIISLEEERLRSFKQEIENSFPEYHSFISDNELQSLDAVKSVLESNQLLVNYFAGQDHYYFIATSGDEPSLGRIAKGGNFNQELSRFLNEVSGENLQNTSMKETFQRYSTSALSLFEKLINDHFDISTYDELIVIPDGDLAGVPFEALISKGPKLQHTHFKQLQYLLKSHEISYGFSATLWSKNLTIKSTPRSLNLMAFGTSEVANRPGLATLSAIEEELSTISQIEGSTLFSQQGATAANFRANVGKANMIHLALHTINDYENPLNSELVFSSDTSTQNGSLYLHEIFSLKMNPSLVVLSGCETGVGKWQKGEGAYHMGRAFLFHGNPAIVMSLWKVKDYPTSVLMSQFYTRFKTQKSSSEALRLSKLNFLANADELMSHPSNWAAFVSIGDAKMTTRPNYSFYLVWLIIGTFLWVLSRQVYKMVSSPGN